MNEAPPKKKEGQSSFQCSICLDPPTEPVVTRCGHLFW